MRLFGSSVKEVEIQAVRLGRVFGARLLRPHSETSGKVGTAPWPLELLKPEMANLLTGGQRRCCVGRPCSDLALPSSSGLHFSSLAPAGSIGNPSVLLFTTQPLLTRSPGQSGNNDDQNLERKAC